MLSEWNVTIWFNEWMTMSFTLKAMRETWKQGGKSSLSEHFTGVSAFGEVFKFGMLVNVQNELDSYLIWI